MSSGTTVGPATPATARPAVRVVAWALVVLWLAVSAAAVLTGARSSTYDDLERALRDGTVTEVAVVGGLTVGARGRAAVRLEWREGWLLRRADVEERAPARGGADVRRARGTTVVAAPVADRLRELQPGVEIEHRDFSRSGLSVWGIPVPGWLSWAFLVAIVATLAVLVATPRPWRATRWGWFWLLWTLPPVGLLAFLLLGGPSGLAAPRHGARRLGGGWAFVLLLVLGGGTVLGGTFV